MPLGFAAAAVRLNGIASGGGLLSASTTSYDEGITGLMRVGPAPGISRLVRASLGEVACRVDAVSLPVRWEAAGPGGRLFPALDADIQLRPAGGVTVLRLDGVYRPPLGKTGAAIDQAVLHAVATATIHRFLARIADLLSRPDPSQGSGDQPRTVRGAARPGAPGGC